MDNREDLLDALNDFTRKQPKEIPPLLEQYLKQVAKTGETLFPWTLLKTLFVAKLEQVMQQFGDEFGSDHIPQCPNVENARFDVYRERIMEAINRFHGAPFTVQRLCELLTDPKRHYKRCDKFMRGLEKNVLVVSTVDPYGRKVVSEGKTMVNGMDTNNSASPTPEDLPSTAVTGAPPVPVWNTSSPTTVWPLGLDSVATDVTTSSALLEVSETPSPGNISPALSTPTSSTTDPVAGTGEAGSLSDVSSTGAVETLGNADLAAPAVTVNGTHALSSEAAAVPVVEAGVDSSVQQVAAEEMVMGEDIAMPTAQEAPVDTVVQESVVETSPAEPLLGEAVVTSDFAETTTTENAELLSTAQEKELDAVPCSTPETSCEAPASSPVTASSTLPSDITAHKTEESPAKSTSLCSNSDGGVQTASSSGEPLSEMSNHCVTTVSGDTPVIHSTEQRDITDTKGESTTATHADDGDLSSDSLVAASATSDVSSSEDLPSAFSQTVDPPVSSTTSTSSETETSTEAASDVTMGTSCETSGSNSAAVDIEVDTPASTEDTESASKPVSDSSHEAMEQD